MTKILYSYAFLSVTAFLVVIFPINNRSFYDGLAQQLLIGNEIVDFQNQRTLDFIERQVKAYPDFKPVEDRAFKVNTIINKYVKQADDFSININDSLLNPLLIDDKEYYFSNEEGRNLGQSLMPYNQFSKYSSSAQLFSTFNQTALTFNKYILLNFFAEKVSGSHNTNCWSDYSIPVLINHETALEWNRPTTFQLALGRIYDSRTFQTTKISVNGERLSLRDQKARFKTIAKKSGWNEINISIEGKLKGKPMKKEKTVRYYVR